MPIKRRALTSFGVKPIGECNYTRESFWIYGATEIISGETLYWEFDKMHSFNFRHFIKDLSEVYSDSLNIILIDNAPIHRTTEKPDNIVFINIPPYNPELNPEERVWQHFKSDMGYLKTSNINHLKKIIYDKILKTPKEVIKSLTSYPYITEALETLKLI